MGEEENKTFCFFYAKKEKKLEEQKKIETRKKFLKD